MKRLLALCLLFLCIIPLVSAAGLPAPIADYNYFPVGEVSPAHPYFIHANEADVIDFCEATSTPVTSHGSGIYQTFCDPSGSCGGDTSGDTGYSRNTTYVPGSLSNSMPYAAYKYSCNGTWVKAGVIAYTGFAPDIIANFTATPRNASAPAYIAFTDTSENTTRTCTYVWSYTPNTGVLVAPQDLDNEDITMLFTENGNFTITHEVSCGTRSDTETKTDYIHILNATGLSTFRVRAVDMLSGYGVNGAQVDVFDIENSSWKNQTSVTGEVTVTAVTGHNINAYGSATGYDDGESLGLPVVAGSLYPIYMRPTDLPGNVSAGNVTLYLTVLEDGTNTRLSGYAVSLTGPSSGGADYTAGVTDDNGVFTAVVKNKTNYNVKVIAQKGHLGANKNFNSGTQSGGDSYVEVTMWLGVNTITTAPTVTTLPGGGTPTPTVTYLANCDPKAADYDAAKCRTSKGGSGLNILADNLEGLIWICLIVTVVYFIKGMGR